MTPVCAAILGPGNIGTDLLVKLMRDELIDVQLVAGIYEDSPGLARAREMGVATSAEGVDAVLARDDITLVFDATSARAHLQSAPALEAAGKRVVDLTPAAIGPYVVPAVNLTEHLDAPNVNLVTCGGQATIPFVHAIDRVAGVEYAEIVATIASAGAGPGTRQNIDEFTRTTARGLEIVGGAGRGKAIIILNPAVPPILMRDTIFAQVSQPDGAAIADSVGEMVRELMQWVPGLRLIMCETDGDLVTTMIEIEGAGDFLPTYSGNLDIMTAAAARVGHEIAARLAGVGV
jgi:acetaldehyde dehydrogenase